MEALYSGQSFDDTGQPESVRNLLGRYADIVDQFPEELTREALPYFVDSPHIRRDRSDEIRSQFAQTGQLPSLIHKHDLVKLSKEANIKMDIKEEDILTITKIRKVMNDP